MNLRRLFTAGHWTRGTVHIRTHDGKDHYCFIGGLRHVTGFKPSLRPPRQSDDPNAVAYWEAYKAFGQAAGTSPVNFNDRTSAERVIQKIDEAVKILDGKEATA
jgi:hypothetical protein